MDGLKNPVAGKIGYQLRRSSTIMMADLQKELAMFDIKPAEASSVLVISENEGCTQTEIGKVLGIKRANMVPIISQLMKRGMVDRQQIDGRSKALSLTEDGKDLARQLAEKIESHEARFTDLLTDKEVDFLISCLRKIRGRSPKIEE